MLQMLSYIFFYKILLAVIALSDAQSSTWTRIHSAILFIDASTMLIR